MSLTLKVNNTHTFVCGEMSSDLYQAFKKALGYKDPQAVFRNNSGKWDGMVSTVCYNHYYCKCSNKKDGTHFPTGLLSKAKDFFDYNNIECNLIDERAKVVKNINLSQNSHYPPYDYQEDAIKKSCYKGRGIIKIATGGGKTRIGAGIIAELGCGPFNFYVTSLDLLKQAKSELEKFVLENGVSLKIGEIGGGKCDIRDINVITVQTAIRSLGESYVKYDDEDEWLKPEDEEDLPSKDVSDVIRSAKGMIADEVQHWAAKTCQVISDNSISARYKFGLSATPWRDLGDDLLIDACFGKSIVDINASFLIKKNILVPPSIYFIHTPRRQFEGGYQTVYKEGIVENEERNAMIVNIAKKMIENGRQVLALVKHIPHGEQLESMLPESFFIHGSHNEKERSNHIDLMRKREAKLTISTSIMDEGVDVKPLDCLILCGSGKSQTRALQRVGRVIRSFKDDSNGFVKKDAIVIDFHDNIKFMNSHSKKRRQIYETEPEFSIKDLKAHG